MLDQNAFPGIRLEVWVARARALLQTVYGDPSPQLGACPVPGHDSQIPVPADRLRARLPVLAMLASALAEVGATSKIFIGHGRAAEWLKLKDFLSSSLRLPVDEFNLQPVAGIHTTDRLKQMRTEAGLAFLVMTGEDQLADGTLQARPNVIHEVGLFQGQLGSRRAIVMIEDGCISFSNLDGLTTIRFPRGDISARYEQVRGVLVREGFLRQ